MTCLAPMAPVNLDEVMERLKSNRRLGPTRKRDLISAISVVSEMLGRRSSELPASAPELREALSGIQPRSHDKSAKTMANIVRRQSFPDSASSLVTEALVRFLSEFRRQRLDAASGVCGWSVS